MSAAVSVMTFSTGTLKRAFLNLAEIGDRYVPDRVADIKLATLNRDGI